MNDVEARPRTPTVVWLLAGAIVLTYAVYYFAPRSVQIDAEFALALIPERYHPGPLRYPNWADALAPIMGHAFLHVAWWHAGVNAFFLFGASRWVALRMGTVRYLAVFFASVVGGALAFLAIKWNAPAAAAVGASGGVCGMFSAYFLAARPTWREALRDPRTRNPLLMLIFLNVVVMGAAAELGVFPIAWEGHLGGFIGGALAYVALQPKPRGPWD